MDVTVDVSGPISASEIRYSDRSIRINAEGGTIHLVGNAGAFRAFAEMILMAVPLPRVIGSNSSMGVGQ